ncbi:MAG: YkvA family protein [Caldilineales bacterium]
MATEKNNNVLQEILQSGQLAYKLYTDPQVSGLLKVLLPALAFGYFILPVDILPDFIPFLGQLDEVAIFLLLMRLFISLAPPEVVAKYRSGTATQNSNATTGRDDVIDADFHVVNDG